jgi:hypothetical protein
MPMTSRIVKCEEAGCCLNILFYKRIQPRYKRLREQDILSAAAANLCALWSISAFPARKGGLQIRKAKNHPQHGMYPFRPKKRVGSLRSLLHG